MESFFDICDRCASRELDFIFFDLKGTAKEMWIKDIPGYRCRDCGEVLCSSGVIDTLDEVMPRLRESGVFPLQRYQRAVIKATGVERNINERLLHSWDHVKVDGREGWNVMGFRTFGDLRSLVAI